MLLALVITGCVLAAGAGLMVLSDTDRAMSANFRDGAGVGYAADALAAYVVAALGRPGAFGSALQPGGQSGFAGASLLAGTSWGTTVDLANETSELQQRTNSRWPRGADTPVWHLFAWGSFDRLVPALPAASPYLVAWVADNPTDGDGDPNVDADGVMVVRSQARLGQLVRTLEMYVTTRSIDGSVTADGTSGEEAAGAGEPADLAQILPASEEDTAAGTTLVRVISWREVP